MNQPSEIYRLYGDSRSGNCYKAALILRLTKRPFEWVETDVMQRETRTERFLAMNPNGRVPLLVLPDGSYLSESNAILIHLAEGSPWLPVDDYERALTFQWLFFEQYSHEPYIAVARFIVALQKSAEEQPERMAHLLNNGHAALGVMETRLGEAPFLAGSDFTIADIALYAYTHTAGDGGFELAPYTCVSKWLKRVESQPGFLTMKEACR
jgi:glutathione S-transferase